MQIEIASQPQRLVPATSGKFAANWGGQFFAETASLDSGDYTAKVQIIFSEYSAGEQVTIRVRSLSRRATLTETNITADLADRRKMDEIYLSFSLAEHDDIEISGHTEANCSTCVLRYITIVEGDGSDPSKFMFDDIGVPRIADIRTVNFGTTGVCNASCIHCPTNKDTRKAMPHGRMSMELFRKIIAELAENEFLGELTFGLFAEPLDDPLLRQRFELIKSELPRCRMSIATNCGLFDARKHGFILDFATHIGVHVESVEPDVYNTFMDPMKADRVLPRVLSLLDLAVAKGKTSCVQITTPVHKGNIAGLPKLSSYFSKYKSSLELTGLSNRCWEEGPYAELSLAPSGGYCAPRSLHDNIFIDWDGALVPCCFDFSKSMILGELSKQSLQEIFRGEAWQAMYETFRGKRWSEKEACSRCRVDHQDTLEKYIAPFITTHAPAREFSPLAFSFTERAVREPDGSIVSPVQAENGVVVFGPYVRLPAGHYRVHSHIEVEAFSDGISYLTLDANADMKGPIAERRVEISITGPLACSLELALERDTLLEFRVRREGPICFKYTGAVLLNLGPYQPAEVSEAVTEDTLHHEDDSLNHAERKELPALAFSHTNWAAVDDDGTIVSDPDVADGNVIFGPYMRLPAGRYRVRHDVDVHEFIRGASRLHFDVSADGNTVIATRRVAIANAGSVANSLDFSLERETTTEFRVHKQGPIRFRHRGATLWMLDQPAPEETKAASLEKEFSAHSFSISALGTRDAEGNIVSNPQESAGNVVHGPYVPMPAGRYRVRHHIRILESPQREGWIEADVSAGHSIIAAKRLKIAEPGLLYRSLDFVLSQDAVVEFRINKKGQVDFKHSGASIRSLGEDEPFEPSVLPEEPEATPAEHEDLTFSETNEIAIAPAEFSIAQQTAHETTDGIVAPADSADGNVIYGPYLRVPAGRYRIHAHVHVEERPGQGAQLGMDVYAADQETVIAERWVAIADEGPVAGPMDFSLDHEALLEFRVNKKGNIGFRHAGATLRRLDQDEPFDASPLPPNDTDVQPITRFGGSWFRRLGL